MNITILGTNLVVPVVVIDDKTAALPLAETLLEVGISTMEITLRTPNALAIIEEIAKQVPQMIVGAGTIRNEADFKNALTAGAKYLISPGITPRLLACADNYRQQALYIPGIVNPSQAMECAEAGFNYLKFFPAEPYNAYAVIKSLASVFPELKFCPTGGISPDNMAKYLALNNIFAVGMSSLVESKLIQSHDFAAIKRLAQAAMAIAKPTSNSL
jgi:2-dehydro-3-deoxyphosphogluconate aldolase/(4S)-4-hydroxy-2-oxoglutarate aldolase